MQVILNFLIKALVLCTAFPVHEFAHAWTADKLGDHTARYQGRLTLDPRAHIDIWGAIVMVLVGFGWAKPVPVNPNNFKNPKVGMAVTSLAGPVSNLIMAYFAMIIYKILYYIIGATAFTTVFLYVVVLNVGLAVFNLIPIPPLDGSRIATLFMNQKTYFKIMQYERYIFLVLVVVVYSGLLDTPLNFCRSAVINVMDLLTGFIDVIFR